MKKLIKYLKVDKFSELYGIPFGIIVGIIIGKTYNIYVGILSFILISIVLGNIFRTLWYFRYAKKFNEYHDKNIMVKPEDLRGFSKNVDDILDLDKELSTFLDKYSSGKENDFVEKELNKQWKIHGNEFTKKAHEIYSKMNNSELMYSLLGTNEVHYLVDIFKYFKPFKININELKKHPEKAMEFYIENLTQQKAIRNTAINDYYYDRIKELNYFDEIEKVILSYMSNDELMELANNSKDWYEKLYYYGFIKSNSKDGD